MSECTDNSSPVVSVSRIGKKFAKSLGPTLRYGLADIGREFLFQGEAAPSLRPGEFWALENVSFDLKRGEALAIIGRNGSGKSTLLKLLHGLIKPDTGEISIRGRMAALIELGAGFDPILSGHENVYINASILGLTREEVDEVLPAIIEFSGLRDFMETPVKFYSSGMRARLAYSIATNLSPDIFLVDEVLAVGDMEFRQKCLRNMVDFVERGGSLVLISHAASQVQMVCNRGIVLESGKVGCRGTALEALDYYYRSGLTLPQSVQGPFAPPEKAVASIVSLEVEPGLTANEIRPGGEVSIVVTAEFYAEAEVVAHIGIASRDLQTIVASELCSVSRLCAPGRHVFRFRIPRSPLMPGLFHATAALRDARNSIALAFYGVENAPLAFIVSGKPTADDVRAQTYGQLVRIEGEWE